MRKDNELIRDCTQSLNNVDRFKAYFKKRSQYLMALAQGNTPPAFKIQVYR